LPGPDYTPKKTSKTYKRKKIRKKKRKANLATCISLKEEKLAAMEPA